MQFEIERRWLLHKADLPLDVNIDLVKHYPIKQGYITPTNKQLIHPYRLNKGAEGVIELEPRRAETFRLRRSGDAYFFTWKHGGNVVRLEYEVQLTKEQFEIMWNMVGEQYLEKDRYLVRLDVEGKACYPDTTDEGHLMEIDFFRGPLRGLIMVEIEFPSEEEASKFSAPSWFGEELTENSLYTNYSLAVNGAPELG